jgi:hypothetical protein
MPVERTYAGHRTRYALRVGATLVCALTFGGPTREQPVWKFLLPGPNGTEDLYATRRFPRPDAEQLRAWLNPIVGAGHAATLAEAVDAGPSQAASWGKAGQRLT